MKITRSRKHHISLGNYEFIEVGAEVTVEVTESGIEAVVARDPEFHLPDDMDRVLDDYLAAEIEEARQVSAEKKSYIHIYQKDI